MVKHACTQELDLIVRVKGRIDIGNAHGIYNWRMEKVIRPRDRIYGTWNGELKNENGSREH